VAGGIGDDWPDALLRMTGQLVAMVAADGAPLVTRGWGVRVVDGGRRARVVLSATEVEALGRGPGHEAIGTDVALTTTDIRSLRSVQVKGAIDAVGPADVEDLRAAAAYRRAFFADVHEMDRLPYELLERMVPDELVACSFRIREAFDQTPGEGAGRRIDLPEAGA
jgi:hypothetical protein